MEKPITVAVPIEVLSLKIFIQPGRASLEIKSSIIELAKKSTILSELIEEWGAGTTKPWWAIEELIAEGIILIEDGKISLDQHFQSLSTREEIFETLKQITGWWAKRKIVIDGYQNTVHSFRTVGRLEDQPIGLFEERDRLGDGDLMASIDTGRLTHLIGGSNRTHGVSCFDDEPEVSEVELLSRESNWSLHLFEPVKTSDGWTLFRPQEVTSLSDICIRQFTTELLGRPPIDERHELEHAPEALASKALEIYRRHLWHLRNNRELATDERLWALLQDVVHKCEDLMTALEEGNGGDRADECRVLYGTGWEQEQAVHHIVRRAETRCLILSSFLNEDFTDYSSNSFSNSWNENVDLRFWYGHSNNESQSEAAQTCDKYTKALTKHVSRPWNVTPTSQRTHAKIALNDKGELWIGSWNALSAAPDSDVAESGVFLSGVKPTSEVLNIIREWAPNIDGATEFLDSILEDLKKQNTGEYRVKSNVIKKVNGAIQGLKQFEATKRKPWTQQLEEHLITIERFLSDLAERPCYSLIRTGDHRKALLDMISTADTNVIIASDRIKSAGFDTSLQHLLATQSAAMTRVSKFEIRIAWGREDPLNGRGNKDIEEAKNLISKFQDIVSQVRKAQKPTKRQGGASGFSIDFMTSRGRTMLTHAKLIQVDDRTMMLTSDNLLVYGDKRIDGDSAELGIVIHHPRMSLILRGEMELMHPELRAGWDHTRWRVALAQEVARSPSSTCSLGEAMGNLWNRVSNAEQARMNWEPSIIKDFRGHLFKRNKDKNAAALRLVNLATKNRLIVVKKENLRKLMKAVRKDGVDSEDVDKLQLNIPTTEYIWLQ